jgi:hypothetical protein
MPREGTKTGEQKAKRSARTIRRAGRIGPGDEREIGAIVN